jgi:hypothetical protein
MFVQARPADNHSIAYLLGVYLGDGYVADTGRSYQLVITVDAAYPDPRRRVPRGDGAHSAHVTPTCAPAQRPPLGPRYGWVAGLAAALPQVGPGRKHERPIVLAAWQRDIVERQPWQFVRGLIHSDGCRSVNRFKTLLPSGRVAEYAYPRYFFSSLSADIRSLLCTSCDQLGVRWTQSNHRNISISHRASVALLDEYVGAKR